ncbi:MULTISPECIES: dethiobiotin synthase [Acetobacteraceae]|uniref:dethiobiotin synthase n=1 Tax=Acetobacteraceae TaxID=433 RepID=UPI0012B9E09A|nr:MULTISPECIES: dethiobiotin synthase [Acetobacteraceae]MCL1514278.1 dethiobiotin synthase [Parasaccharibacter sp. TMW 2.1891]MCL1563533.1 dethiobiotin synthase [Parasaccharibacter sp. TMW 2.1886]MPW00062.1 dethiobiotin synthase [Bombella apis]
MLLSPPSPLPQAAPQGVFVTGTDTGVGKTLTSAILTKAWQGTYWKPFQTGLAEEEGDTPTVQRLTGLPDRHFLPPAHAFQAPLAPAAAGLLEGVTLDPDQLTLPAVPQAPLIVEGAGGLMVPLTDTMLMIDLIARLGLPVILVTRSGLGTLNHTLLSLEALYRRDIPVLGFITNGPASPQNSQTLERLGRTRSLHHLPAIPGTPEPHDINRITGQFPSWEEIWNLNSPL